MSLKKDFKKNAEDTIEFYSNPRKYLAKVHVSIKIGFPLYVLGFLAIIRFSEMDAMTELFVRVVYIASGYFSLVYLHKKYQE